MDVQHKDATISNTDDTFPGSFEVILSTNAKDRDGDELQPEDWKQPLPEHITFDADHGMSVATTVGSGTPSIEDGKLVVRGTYSSLQRAQEVRTLVNEGHIRTTSVAFMTEKSEQKDGTTKQVRELLNGAFVAIPSNREALVMSSKSAKVDEKAGARNSASDQEKLQAAHDAIVAAGAACDSEKSFKPASDDLGPEGLRRKSIVDSLEAAQDRATDALEDGYGRRFLWLRGVLSDVLVFDLISDDDSWEVESYRQAYTDDGSVVTLVGDPEEVDILEVVRPDADESSEQDESDTEAAKALGLRAQALRISLITE